MATTRRHGDTQAPLEGFEGAIESALEWLQDRQRAALTTALALLLLGGLTAGVYEWLDYVDVQSHSALDRVERELTLGLGGLPGDFSVPEPANPDQALSVREQALAGFESVIEEHGSRLAGRVAILKAAEVEIGLGRLEAAEARLRAAGDELASWPLLRGGALRLHGYVLEELGRPGEAGEAYASAATVPEYPAPELLWVAAAESFLRADQPGRALGAFHEALELAPDQARLRERVESLEALRDSAPEPPPAAPAGG